MSKTLLPFAIALAFATPALAQTTPPPRPSLADFYPPRAERMGISGKADLECGNEDARKADMAQVDQWREKAMSTRKANEEKKNEKANGVVM